MILTIQPQLPLPAFGPTTVYLEGEERELLLKAIVKLRVETMTAHLDRQISTKEMIRREGMYHRIAVKIHPR